MNQKNDLAGLQKLLCRQTDHGCLSRQVQFNNERMTNIMAAAFVIPVLFSGMVSAQDNIEKKKIRFLISSVENSKGSKLSN
jgi:hypothetical protein